MSYSNQRVVKLQFLFVFSPQTMTSEHDSQASVHTAEAEAQDDLLSDIALLQTNYYTETIEFIKDTFGKTVSRTMVLDINKGKLKPLDEFTKIEL